LFVIINYSFAQNEPVFDPNHLVDAKMLVEYFEQMSVPKPFVIREGQQLREHQRQLRQKLLECIGLSPLPERIPLDIHETKSLDHPWCTVQRIYYQLWPGVYASGLLYMPKEFPEKPAPIMLCPHGHWENGNANPIEQTRCLVFAKMGYIVFAPNQNHYEDLALGISNQTLGVWNNMRALDFLQTLHKVDANRIGVCGCSGGGLQTEMLLALDNRVKAATIAGMTCDFREILFPHRSHCNCNHYPNVMRYTDAPEISTLGLPVPILYLTMNDWTKNFRFDNFPRIQLLHTVNGFSDKVHCIYEPTEHTYDKSKREYTYWWMEKWLRNKKQSQPSAEPNEVQSFTPQELLGLTLPTPNDSDFNGISSFYQSTRHYKVPKLTSPEDIRSYRSQMLVRVKDLLGEDARLPKFMTLPESLGTKIEDDLVIERVNYPSEGAIRVPTVVLCNKNSQGKFPVVIICDAIGKDTLLRENGSGSARQLARSGKLVVLPDVRFFGELSLETLSKEISPALMKFNAAKIIMDDDKFSAKFRTIAWERNSIVWGRPLAAMACTDISAVLDGLASRPDADVAKVQIVSRNSGSLAMAVIFAAALDNRITSIDVDLQNCCYENRKLPVLPFVLQYGDVLQWAALLGDKKLTIYDLPPEAGDPNWLAKVFDLSGNRENFYIKQADKP
jgi:dienelactone hydrolase